MCGKWSSFRPLIRGFFFYRNEAYRLMLIAGYSCFRPLIRGFFFYEIINMTLKEFAKEFPSPHSGILFLFERWKKLREIRCRRFPSPHSGILFLCENSTWMNKSKHTFPSPHSGILFLSCRYDMPPSLNIFAIFQRILHFLAQKGSPLTQSIHFSPYPSASARIKSFFHPYCTVSNSS